MTDPRCKRCGCAQVLRLNAPRFELNRWSVFVTGVAPCSPQHLSAGEIATGRRVVEQWDLLDLVIEICDGCASKPDTTLWALEYALAAEREIKRCAKCCGAFLPNTTTCPICDVV